MRKPDELADADLDVVHVHQAYLGREHRIGLDILLDGKPATADPRRTISIFCMPSSEICTPTAS
ncbi:hypothetical protein [Nocardia pseudobrasiliensis]|uniref:Uncharacterized protein n=1 Tax=Nocardia pseudobrasiliensis TaxID=45979 RepID=A0A370I727_9NOCA|nr:hypothetical protein [Nocardia pseudobrasiliensis]RDI65911.1 hypothetical protein DFR76_105229 [Nocardia pseudobrasiliensis]